MKLITRSLAKWLVLMGLMVLSASSFAQCPANSRPSAQGQTGAFELTSNNRLGGPGTGIFCASNPGYYNEATGVDLTYCPGVGPNAGNSDRLICPVPQGQGTTFPPNSQQGARRYLAPIGGGRYRMDFVNVAEAGPGYYLGGGTVTPCPAGSYTPNGNSTSCSPARLGFFVSSTAQSSDTICPRNTKTTQRGQTSCTPANPNETLDVNVARAGPTSQRSTYGNPNIFDRNNGLTVNPTNERPSELMVSLQGSFALSGIQINNRQDCCQDRLIGATVQVLDSAGNVQWSTLINAAQGVYLFTPAWGTIASYVRIRNKPGQNLNIADVQVFVPAYVYTTTGWGQ